MTERTVSLLKQPVILLEDSDPDVIDLTSTSHEESENEETATELTDEKTEQPFATAEQSESHVVGHSDAQGSLKALVVNEETTTKNNDARDGVWGVFQSDLNTTKNKSKPRRRNSDTPTSDFRELDSFFEGKIRSIGVNKVNRLPVENALSRERNQVQTTPSDEANFAVPQSTQKVGNSSSISTSTSSDPKKDNSTFISGIYSGINKVRNLLLPNSLFTQDKIDEGNKETLTKSDGNTDRKDIPKHERMPSGDFKLPHPTSQSTRNTTLDTSSLEWNSSNGPLSNRAGQFIQKSQIPSSSLVMPDSTTSLSSSSQSQGTQPSNMDKNQKSTGKIDGKDQDSSSSSSKKTLLPRNSEPLRSKNPFLQFSQVDSSAPQLKIKKRSKTKKTKARKVKKVVGSTDEEEDDDNTFHQEANSLTDNHSAHQEGRRISSYGLQTITTDKIGKITSSKTFVSEEIGLDENVKIASSGGLFDDEDHRHKRKELSTGAFRRPHRTTTLEEGTLNSDEENFSTRRNSRRPEGFFGARLELSASDNEGEIESEEAEYADVLQVNQYLNALEHQSENSHESVIGEHSLDDSTVTGFNAKESKEIVPTGNVVLAQPSKLEESQATQSNVIDDMLSLYEEEFQKEKSENILSDDGHEVNKDGGVECSPLFVPEDDNESEDSSCIGDADTMVTEYFRANGKLDNEEETEESGNKNSKYLTTLHEPDEKEKILVARKDKKKQISNRLMTLARHKRKKKLSEYNPYSDSSSNSDDTDDNSDYSENSSDYISGSVNKVTESENFIANDDSVEFESDSDSGDELTKKERITKPKNISKVGGKRVSRSAKRKRKVEKDLESSDDEEQQKQKKKQQQKRPARGSQRRIQTRSNRLKEKKVGDKEIIILDSDSSENLGEQTLGEQIGNENDTTNTSLGINIKTELDSSVILPEENVEDLQKGQLELPEIAVPGLPEKESARQIASNLLPTQNNAATNYILPIDKKDQNMTGPEKSEELGGNREKQTRTHGYPLEEITKNVEKNDRKSIRKHNVKKKKKAPKIIDNSLLAKLNEKLRQKHEKKMRKTTDHGADD